MNRLLSSCTAALTLAALAICACGCTEKSSASSANLTPIVPVLNAIQKNVTDYEYFTGRTEAPDSLDVRAKVSGYLVRWNFADKSDKPPTQDYNFVAGQEVKRDQVLFKIDPRPYQATYDQAVAQINLAKAQLQLAKADYARALNVAKTPGAISQQDVDKYFAAQGKAEAEVAAQEANAESARLNLDYTNVKSDIDGIVGRNLLSVGNLVEANTLLTTVVSQNPMYAYFDVDEQTMIRVQNLMREGKLKSVRENNREKYPVDIGLSNGTDEYPYVATIDFVNNQVDPTTGTLQVRGIIDNPLPKTGPRVFSQGMYLRVRLPIGPEHPALLLPQAAIATDQGQKYVLIVNAENVVEQRPINVGQTQAGGMQVVIPEPIVHDGKGVRPATRDEQGEPSLTLSDRVIVGNLQRVRPGMKVEIKPAQS